MEKFLLLIREDLKKLSEVSEDEFNKDLQLMTTWIESLSESGDFGGGEPLLTTGRYVKKDHVLSDGPFLEAKEAISGYLIITAENLDQAASITQTCPLVINDKIAIEVRPILEVINK